MGAIGEAALLALGDAAPGNADERLHRLMAAVQPDQSDTWRDKSLGAVTRLILNARAEIIGDQLDCVATCPSCVELMSIEVTVAELCGAVPKPAVTVQISCDDLTVTARAPTPADLADAAHEETFDALRWRLINSCIIKVTRSGVEIDIQTSELDPEHITAIGSGIDEGDPLIDPVFALVCPECDTAFAASLDAATFVYGELASRGADLLYQVDALALRYGWSEAEILTLSPRRRARYLELV